MADFEDSISSTGDCTDVDLLEIHDGTITGGCKAVLAPNGSLAIHGAPKNDVKSQGNAIFHEASSTSSLHNRHTRKLVNECHGIFLSIGRLTSDSDEMTLHNNIKTISQKYHSVLLACMEDLGEARADENLSEEDISSLKTMFSEIELISSLIEILLFDMHSRSLIVYRLLEWIQWHFTDAEKTSEEILEADEPWEHPKYWDTVLQFVLQGNMDSARSLLKLHKSKNREDLLSMDELLRKMPLYYAETLMSWNEFQMRWRHWQEECRKRLSEGEFSGIEGLEDVCQILCGNKEMLSAKSYLCNTWYHLLVSVLLYTDPCIPINVLGPLAKSYSTNVTAEAPMSHLDQIILDAMELDVVRLLEKCSKFNDGKWFVAHMTDLLYRGNFVGSSTSSCLNSMREWYLTNYAAFLMTHKSLWQIGPDYLDQCEKNGREYTELWLQRVPLTSEFKARKVLHLAKKRDLVHLVKSVYRIMTTKAIENEAFGSALSWVVQSKDAKFATELANRWIKEYTETGKFQCFEVLKNLGVSMLVSDELTFLGKYCEFHKLYQEKDFKSAAKLLVALVTSGLVPQQFKIVLLLDALPLLEATEPVFMMDDTTQLMACLEDVCGSDMKEEDKTGLMKKEKLIRLALARNLARAFIYQNSVS